MCSFRILPDSRLNFQNLPRIPRNVNYLIHSFMIVNTFTFVFHNLAASKRNSQTLPEVPPHINSLNS